jgi:ribose 5-phosphate isomerase B
MLPIFIGADHAGFILKEYIKTRLNDNAFSFEDVGCYTQESVDYPNFAEKVSLAIQEKKAELGILVCGSGEGMVIAANKFSGIRAGLAWNTEVAALLRQHNDAQIICLGSRFTASEYAWKMVEAFLNAKFEGGNHARRVELVNTFC